MRLDVAFRSPRILNRSSGETHALGFRRLGFRV